MRKDINNYVRKCSVCQLYKQTRPSYGEIPPPDVEYHPWRTVCVDCYGYSVVTRGHTYTLIALTMADPSTGWFEIMEIPNKQSETVARAFDRTWLCRYPRPSHCRHDNGPEFTGAEFQEMLSSYGIESKPTLAYNPQANFVERVHLTLGNMLRTCELEDYPFEMEDPWTDIISKCAWAIRSTTHLVLGASPGELIFGRNMLFDLSFRAAWANLRKRKQDASRANNARTNAKRIKYDFNPGDKVTLDRPGILMGKGKRPREGPFNITKTYTNGTIRIKKGPVSQVVHLKRVHRFFE